MLLCGGYVDFLQLSLVALYNMVGKILPAGLNASSRLAHVDHETAKFCLVIL